MFRITLGSGRLQEHVRLFRLRGRVKREKKVQERCLGAPEWPLSYNASMGQQHFDKFREAVAPFLNLWSSGRVACITAATSGHFINLATRIVFTAEPISPNAGLRIVENFEPTPDFRAVVADLPKSEITQLVHKVVAMEIFELEVGREILQVHLTRAHAGLLEGVKPYFNWIEMARHPRAIAQNRFGLDRTCFVLEGYQEQTRDLVSPDRLERINCGLRSAVPLIDGMDELFSKLMPGLKWNSYGTAPIQLVAPLPFDLAYDHTNGLRVRAPRGAFDHGIRLSIFFEATQKRLSWQLTTGDSSEINQAGIRQWEKGNYIVDRPSQS